MHIPKIIFTYSGIYDAHWKGLFTKDHPDKAYASEDEILTVKSEIVDYWNDKGKELLEAIAKYSKLEWKSTEIKCYFVGWCVPFSDPLTMPVSLRSTKYNKQNFIDTLTHELIHCILVDNSEKLRNFKIWRNENFPNDSLNVWIHIPVHAILKAVYLNVLGEDRLKADIEFSNRMLPGYKRAWNIVEEVGYQNIIDKFLS